MGTRGSLDFVANHDAETAFTERLVVPLEEGRVIEWLVAALQNLHELQVLEVKMIEDSPRM